VQSLKGDCTLTQRQKFSAVAVSSTAAF